MIPISSKSILILSSHLHLGLPKSLLPVKMFKAFLHSGYMACPSQYSIFNHPDYIRWTVQTMKFLIVEPSPLPILIPLGSKYSPQVLDSLNVVTILGERYKLWIPHCGAFSTPHSHPPWTQIFASGVRYTKSCEDLIAKEHVILRNPGEHWNS